MRRIRFSGTVRYKPKPGQNIRPNLNQQEKSSCYLVDFTVSAKRKTKMKENKKIDKSLRAKNMWNMKVTVKPIVSCTIGKIVKE